MGTCASCEATATASTATAMVVMPDGGLREFPPPARAWQVLQKVEEESPVSRFFLCDADEMALDGPPAAVAGDEELRPGQLYFLLPRSFLRRPLLAEEMAALAVKASAVLVGATPTCWCARRRSVAPVALGPGDGASAPAGGDVGRLTVAGAGRRRRGARGGGRGPNFTSKLGAIAE